MSLLGVLDNLSAHKTKRVAALLQQHSNVQFHFTPTYSSWLNQVELWFSKLQRDVIARGVFTSVTDLARKLRRYINAYSKSPQPFCWKYSKPSYLCEDHETFVGLGRGTPAIRVSDLVSRDETGG